MPAGRLMARSAFSAGPVTGPLGNERHPAFNAFLERALLALSNRPGAIGRLMVHGKPRKSRIFKCRKCLAAEPDINVGNFFCRSLTSVSILRHGAGKIQSKL